MKLEKLNPAVKAGTVLLSVILLSFQYLIPLNLTVFCGSLLLILLCSDARPLQVIRILIPALLAAFGLFMMGLYYARGGSVTDEALAGIEAVPYALRAAASRNLTTALQLSTRLLAFAGLGILFALTTPPESFIFSLMHQCRLPPKFAYGTLAAFHLLPNLVREYKNVQTAFAVRGIQTHFFSVKVIFAMLVNCIRWSESVAMAMESKGFSGTLARTFYEVPRVRWYDWLCSALTLSGILLGMAVCG